MRFGCLNIRFQSCDDALQLTDLLREIFDQVIFHPKLLALMVRFQHLQSGDFDIQIHLFFDGGVPRAQSLDFCKGQRCFIHIFAGANRGFGGHYLADEFLLVFHRLPEVRIECPFCDITVDVNLLIHIALTNDSTAPLLQITRSPGAVEIMQGNQSVLHIHTSTHFEGTAHQNTHLTGTNLCKKLLFPSLCIRIMDESNLLCRNATGNQLGANIIIRSKGRIGGIERSEGIESGSIRTFFLWLLRAFFRRSLCFGCRDITEHQLGQLVSLSVLPDAENILHAHIDLRTLFIRKIGVNNPLIQPQLSSIRGDLEHVVLPRLYSAAVNLCRAIRKL